VSTLAEFRKPIRVILGDRDPSVYLYSDTALDDAAEVAIRMGKLEGFTTDGTNISPAITNANHYALLTYEVVKMFVDANPDRYSFKTRAVSESFGSWRDFLFAIEENLHALRNGTMFSGWSDLHSWLTGVARLPWPLSVTEVEQSAPLTTVRIF
jgi:hypothetical protein